MLSHQDRGVRAQVSDPGRLPASPPREMSVSFASIFACPDTDSFPTPAQEEALQGHCAHARYVWNLAVEQHQHWSPGRKSAPGYLEQCRQLTAARADNPWLAAGSQMVQQQALRDFAQAMAACLRPSQPSRAALVAQGGPERGLPGRRAARTAVGRAPPLPQRRPGLGTEGWVGAVPLVSPGAAGGEVLPRDHGPRRALACRLRCHP